MVYLEELKLPKVLNSLPLIFERNIGQHDKDVQFILNKKECTTFFTDKELVLAFNSNLKEEVEDLDNNLTVKSTLNSLNQYKSNVIRISFEDSNKTPQIIGKNEFNCKINYFEGNNQSDWKSFIPIYEKVLYSEIYSGVDLLYYGKQNDLKLEFIVQPNQNSNCISLNFEGADKIEIDDEKNLVVFFDNKFIKLLKLEGIQEGNEEKVECDFEIKDNLKVKFNILNRDLNEVLKINTKFLFDDFKSTKVTSRENSIVSDNDNCIYITGVTNIQEFPKKRIYKPIYSRKDYSVYIAKINLLKNGQASLEYGAYICGNGVDEGISLAVDYNGGVYVAGITNSTEGFPTTEGAYLSNYPGGDITGFLINIDTNEVGVNSLIYGSYLGGNGSDYIYSIALDKNKNIYVVGDTTSNKGFPITDNSYKNVNNEKNRCGFLLKLDTKRTGEEGLLYGTYFGGTISDSFYSLAIDHNDYVYITGVTKSNDFKTTDSGYQKSSFNSLNNAFLVKFDLTKSGEESLLYSTYLSGDGDDIGYSVAVDNNECAYIMGLTTSNEKFPITKNLLKVEEDNKKENGFLIKLDTKFFGEESLIYGRYLDKNNIDICSYIKINNSNYVYIVGFTDFKNFHIDNFNYKDIILIDSFGNLDVYRSGMYFGKVYRHLI